MTTLAERLADERKRLGMNQTDFAGLANLLKAAQINYEKGTRKPNTNYLEAIANHGVDVNYVITGVRNINETELFHELRGLSDAWQAIDEALANANKTMPSDKKRLAAEALYNAVKAGEGQAKPLAELLTKAA